MLNRNLQWEAGVADRGGLAQIRRTPTGRQGPDQGDPTPLGLARNTVREAVTRRRHPSTSPTAPAPPSTLLRVLALAMRVYPRAMSRGSSARRPRQGDRRLRRRARRPPPALPGAPQGDHPIPPTSRPAPASRRAAGLRHRSEPDVEIRDLAVCDRLVEARLAGGLRLRPPGPAPARGDRPLGRARLLRGRGTTSCFRAGAGAGKRTAYRAVPTRSRSP